MRYVYSVISALVFAATSGAQTQTFFGELSSDTPREFGQLTVELQSSGSGTANLDRSFVSADGRFQVRNVPPGAYLVVVRDRHGSTVHQQYANTQGFGGISIRLPEESAGHRPVSGLVSVDELRHSPVKTARKAFEESLKRKEKGDLLGSIASLERAVEIDPEFLQALNNLGSQYVRAGRYQEAVQCFRRTVALAPKTPLVHANLAQSLLFLRDYAGAEASARAAIALNAAHPIATRAQLALGLALAGEGKHEDARRVMVTCTHSSDEVVRRAAEGYLARLR